MKELRIALADPPKKESFYYTSFPNLGLLYLAGSLREKFGERCRVLLLDGHQSMAEHLGSLQRFTPHLYGLSFTYFTRFLAFRTVEQVRRHLPDLPILCGGPMPTAASREVLESCPADICALGEGESTLCELAEHFLDGKGGLQDVDGLVYRDSQGRLHRTAKRSFAADLDKIPAPAWDLIEFRRYPGWPMHRAKPQIQIQVSRGCPFNCNFCSNPVWKYNKPWLRYRSPRNIAKEVQLLYQTGAREIYLSADEFNFSESWCLEVCHELAGLGHADLYFNCNIRPDVMTPRMAKAFKKANLWCAHVGIDSGNQRTLDGVGKKVQVQQIVETCRILKENDLNVFGFVMLFHAWEEEDRLCWEGPAEVKNTLRFCRYLLRSKLLDYMSWQVATPMPGSRLWDTAGKYDLFPEKEATCIYTRNLALPGLGTAQVRLALIKGLWLKNRHYLKNGRVNWRDQFPAIWPNLRVMLGFPPPKGSY